MDINEIILKHLPGADILPLDNDPESNHTCLVVTHGPLRLSLYQEGSIWTGSGRWREPLLEVHAWIPKRDPSPEKVIRLVIACIREQMQSDIFHAEEQVQRSKVAMDRLPC